MKVYWLLRIEIEANKKVAISWLLHTLSQPQADGNGLVSLERNGINLSIKPITGLPLDCRISDKFAVDINEGVPPGISCLHAAAVSPAVGCFTC
jgi:hypothetical protein